MGKASVSEIDRLIELASDQKPRPSAATEHPANHSLSLEDRKDPPPSMWRILLQLRVLLPYLSRLLPLLERGVLGTNMLSGAGNTQPKPDTTHFDESIAEIGDAHRDLSLQLRNQAVEIRFLQEQVSWLSKSLEKDTQRQEEIAASVASLRRLLMVSSVMGLILLAALIAVVLLRPSLPR